MSASEATDDEDEPRIAVREVFRHFWPLARRERGAMAAACLLATAAAGAEAGAVLLFAAVTDKVLTAKDLAAFWPLAGLWLAVAALGGAAMFGRDLLTSLVSERFLLRLRDRAFSHVQTLSPDFFTARESGDLVARITGDIDAVEGLVASGVVHAVSAFVGVLCFAGAAFWLRWDLTLAAFAVAPVFWLLSRGFTGPFARASRRERAGNGAIAAVVQENIANMMLVQAYNQPAGERQKVHAAGVEWLRARMAEARLAALYGPVVYLAETACVLAVLGFGAWELTGGRISLGALLGFAAFLGLLYPQVQSLGGFGVTAAAAGGGAQRLLEVLGERPAVADLAQTGLYRLRGGRVQFASVAFAYPGRDEPVLRGVDLVAEPGRVLLVTGASGAGKSTLAQLLLRFHDPAAGTIRLDGVDIRDLTLRRLRAEVTLLLQEAMLFDGTVRENIAYGDPSADDARIAAAARDADAAGFIAKLPQGYDTLVGQGGHALSGGQRRRVAIARALLRDTPVLVLDEPTAGLDGAAAQRVLGPLRRLMAGRTTILISHDLRLSADADEILVLDGGRVAQRGTHARLAAEPGLYRELWAAQNPDVPIVPVAGRARAQPPQAQPGPPRPWVPSQDSAHAAEPSLWRPA
jgi:ATP-binding cassette subfamily B protein